MFAGKFQLPSSTSMEEIEQLAESTMASLGLTRVADSIVGDVHIRGVSGGTSESCNELFHYLICCQDMNFY